MRVVIAGGTGSFGRRLPDDLSGHGDEVATLARSPCPDLAHRQVWWEGRPSGTGQQSWTPRSCSTSPASSSTADQHLATWSCSGVPASIPDERWCAPPPGSVAQRCSVIMTTSKALCT